MPATETEKTRLRRQLGDDITSLPDAEIDDLFNEAEELYPNNARTTQFAAVKLQAIRDKLVQAAKRTSYSQGGASESLGELFSNLRVLEQQFKIDLDELIAEELGSPIMWAVPQPKKRSKERPDA